MTRFPFRTSTCGSAKVATHFIFQRSTMAKKNLNPADAHRKALRKKELKKNKAGRTKARDFALVKKDTGDLEDAIEQLTAEDPESPRLQELKDELEKINRKKAEYVAEHPDQRRLVYRPRRKEGEDVEELVLRKRKMFDKNGIPRHPERSIYYDPIMNPFGVAPPGMPYAQRPLLPGEVDSEEDDDDDDDIPMPSGRPPLPDGAEYVDSDEDIPLPDGVPPGKEQLSTLPPLPPNMPSPPSGLDTPMQPPAGLNPFPPPPPPPPGFPASFPQVPGGAQFPILPPTGFPQGMTLPPPPPPVFPGNIPAPGYPQLPLHGFPVQPNFPPFPPTGFAQGSTFLPAPPPGFFPRRIQSSASMQDPLSSVPHQTFQAHRASQLAPPHPSLPQNPTATQGTTLPPTSASLPPRPTTAAELAAATVFAEPQLRDFKKEATAFVPSTLKRKKAADAGSTTKKSKVDAAPALGPDTADDENKQTPIVSARPDLLSVLKGQFGPAPTEGIAASGKSKPEVKKKDDYEKFVEEIGDLLGPKA